MYTVKHEEEVLPPRPAPRGKPEVWADTRQELCESVPYFRAYQGGIYFRDGVVFGYLLDAFGAERDYIGSNVVISHGCKSPLFPFQLFWLFSLWTGLDCWLLG